MATFIRFTREVLDALPVPTKSKYTRYYHEKFHNWCFTVQKSGYKSFSVKCTLNGKTKHPVVGKYPDMKPEAARKKALQILAAVAEGGDPIKDAHEARREEVVLALTVEGAVNKFCREQTTGFDEKPLKPRTQADYRAVIKRLLGKDLFEGPLAAIDHKTLKDCYEVRYKKSKAQAAQSVRSLSSVWTWIAKQDEYEYELPENPVKRFKAKRKLYKPEPKTGRLIVKGDLNELSDWLEEVEKLDAINREFFLWLLFTGNRLGEAMGLEWADINWKTGEYRLNDPKNRQAIELPIPGYLKTCLRVRKKKSGLVFPVNNKGLKVREDVSEAIGKHWSNHDLRRTFAGIAQSAVPYTSVKRLMNHAYEDITEIYVGEAADMAIELDKVERRIFELAGRPVDNVVKLEVVGNV